MLPNCKSVESTNVDYVILPKMDFTRSDIEVRCVDDKKRIVETCFTPTDYESLRRPWILQRDLSDEELILNREKVIDSLLENRQIYECFYHPYMDSREVQDKVKTKILKRNG